MQHERDMVRADGVACPALVNSQRIFAYQFHDAREQ